MAAKDPNHRGRTLILCFDGTGDSFDDDNTNIVRFFSALEKNKPDEQLCYYQPGIGTYVSPAAAWSPTLKKIAEKIDFAIAWYLDTHIMGGYRFLMENYRRGDRICIFGFSRGAYTARCLAGMLHKVGLIPKSNEEQISFAYMKYVDTGPGSRVRAAGFKAAFSTPVDIEFMGVWDTVSSVGLKGRHLPFTSSNTIIRTFRHALSLDERRAKFQPNPWHKPTDNKDAARNDPECGTAVYDQKGLGRLELAQKWFSEVLGGGGATSGKGKMTKPVMSVADVPQQSQGPGGCRPMADAGDVEDVYWNGKETDVKEIWFSGCHTDVGGGSVKNSEANSLANISLCWMLNEIIQAEAHIMFKEGAFSDISAFLIIANPPIFLPSPPLTAVNGGQLHNRDTTDVTVVESPIQETVPKKTRDPNATAVHNRDLTSASMGNSTIVSVQEEAITLDSTSAIHDALAKLSFWWLLEFIPQRHAWQDKHGHWKKGWYLNLGRPRQIQQANPMFHSSVKLRMDKEPNYRPKARYTGTVEYVD